MSRATLSAAANFFFSRILPAATQKHFADLANAEVLLGAYRRYSGAPVTVFGQSITPEFVLKVATTAVPVQGDAPALGDASVPADAANQPLLWMRYLADPKIDDQATIQDLMGDLDTYAARTLNIAGVDIAIPDNIPSPANSQQWAQAIQANRSAVPDNLANLKDVPVPFHSLAPTSDGLKLILSHFFTYDSTGAYYARWAGAGRQLPQDLSPVYRRNNVTELKLDRDQMYLYLVAPKSLFTSKSVDAHDYCEAVLRFDDSGDATKPYRPALIQSVYKRMPEGTAPFHDFVFFEAEDGLGLNVPLEIRSKMTSPLVEFLGAIPDKPEDRAAFFHKSMHVLEGDPPFVLLLAILGPGELNLPAEVITDTLDSEQILHMQAPLDTIPAIAALPGVLQLDLGSIPCQHALDLVRPAIGFDAFRGKFPPGKQDGAGVIVGIIDSGIDGKHPAFNDASGKSRILAYWDQGDGVKGNHESPAAHKAGNNAYRTMNFGRERTGADCMNAVDYDICHGTHVSGIAAGSELASPVAGSPFVPRGIASGADLVVVAAIGMNQQDIGLAAKYIFQKASELNRPCVINMSFGGHNHGHDGTDSLSLSLEKQVRKAGGYLPGRILIAAAGNEGAFPIHARRLVPTGGSVSIDFTINSVQTSPLPKSVDAVTFWVRSTTPGSKPNVLMNIQGPVPWLTGTLGSLAGNHLDVQLPALDFVVTATPFKLDAANGDYNTIVQFSSLSGSPLAATDWRFVITNLGPPVEVNAWDYIQGGFKNPTAADAGMKIRSPACAYDVVSVACSCSRLNWLNLDNQPYSDHELHLGDLASFSSQGPLRTCSKRMLSLFGLNIDLTHTAIDVAAPGSATRSALGSGFVVPDITAPHPNEREDVVNVFSRMMSGTSQASPVITGLVACMLAQEPNLTQDDIRTRLRGAGKIPAGTTNPDPNGWGTGLISAPALKP